MSSVSRFLPSAVAVAAGISIRTVPTRPCESMGMENRAIPPPLRLSLTTAYWLPPSQVMPEYSPGSISRRVDGRAVALRPLSGASGVRHVASQRYAMPGSKSLAGSRADQMRPSEAWAMAAVAGSVAGASAIQSTSSPFLWSVTGTVRGSPCMGTSRIRSMPASAGSPSSCIRTNALAWRTTRSVSPFPVKVVSVRNRSRANRESAWASPLTAVPSSNRTGS